MTRLAYSICFLVLLAKVIIVEGFGCFGTEVSGQRPYPLHDICYQFNEKSCCTSTHDQLIKKELDRLIPTDCSKHFIYLQYFFCAGCNPDSTFIDYNTKQVKVCQEFADNVFKPGDQQYDSCGFFVGSSSSRTNVWINSFITLPWSIDFTVIIPSVFQLYGGAGFQNFSSFINFYSDVSQSYPFRPTLYKDFEIVVSNGSEACMASPVVHRTASTPILVITLFLAVLLFIAIL